MLKVAVLIVDIKFFIVLILNDIPGWTAKVIINFDECVCTYVHPHREEKWTYDQ